MFSNKFYISSCGWWITTSIAKHETRTNMTTLMFSDGTIQLKLRGNQITAFHCSLWWNMWLRHFKGSLKMFCIQFEMQMDSCGRENRLATSIYNETTKATEKQISDHLTRQQSAAATVLSDELTYNNFTKFSSCNWIVTVH